MATRTYYTKKGKGHISPKLNRFVDELIKMGKKKKPKNKKRKTNLAGGAYSADADKVLRQLKGQ